VRTDKTPLRRHLQYRSETTLSPTTQIGVDGFTVTQLSVARTCLRHNQIGRRDLHSRLRVTSPITAPPYAQPQALSPTSATRWRCASPEVENDDTMTMTNLFQRQNHFLGDACS